MINVADVVLINYADNFFLIAKNHAALEFALEALRARLLQLTDAA